MRKLVSTLAATAALGFASSALAGDLLWDNGGFFADSPNAYSAFTGFGSTVAGDFTLAHDSILSSTTFSGVWGVFVADPNIPRAESISLWIRSNNGSSPGAVIATLDVTSFTETNSGINWVPHDRPFFNFDVNFDGLELAAGTYWIEFQVDGNRPFFFGVNRNNGENIVGGETWGTFIPDFMELTAYSQIAPEEGQAELAFQIHGTIIPTPGALALLGLAGLAARRRRRA